MACCEGEETRRHWYETTSEVELGTPTGAPTIDGARPAPSTHVAYEYVGTTAMTVVGPITHRRYRFERSGAVLEIDRRDAPLISTVPNMRAVPPAP